MDNKKTSNLFAAEAENEQNFWMMAQQRASVPGIPGYPGFYPMLRPMAGAPGISPIRHILPQIPTRASNPRTAVSKASMREPFPGLHRSDMLFSSLIPGDPLPLSRDVIWREDCKGGGREVSAREEEMAKMNKLDLLSQKTEFAQDMSMAAVKIAPQSRDEDDDEEDFSIEDDFRKDVGSEREFLRKTELIPQVNQPPEMDDVEAVKMETASDRKCFADDEKDLVENNTSDGPSFPIFPAKSKETTAPTNPIKLKIRCDFKEGQKGLMTIIGNDLSVTKPEGSPEASVAAAAGPSAPLQVPVQQSSPQGLGLLTLAPPSPQTVSHLAPVPSPSMNIVRPKTGRAKTNAELKKQLMEKRAVQYLKGQGDAGSQASSPATSHVDVSSPASLQADAPSPLSTQTEGGVNADALDSSFERSFMSKSSQNGKGKQSGTSGVTEAESPSPFDPPSVETKWVVGDMLWTRVSGHPWWPCIVSPDPFQQIYTKVVTRGHKISFRQYHVQFFGEEGERGWIQESTAIPFEGRTKFDNFCEEMIKEHKKDKRNYTIAPNRRRAWEVAVTSAEHARTMPRTRRVDEYVTMYGGVQPVAAPQKDPPRDKQSISLASKSSDDGATRNKSSSNAKQWKPSIEDPAASGHSTDSGSPPRKKQRLAEPTVESPSHIKLPKNISNQHIVQYTVFCQKRRESVKNEYPDYDDEQVENRLQEQWSKLDDETRSRFIPMGSDFTYLSQMMATVGMPKAPTGVKRSSRFVKPKKGSVSEKQESEKVRDVVATDDAKEKDVLKEEKRTPRHRTSAEKKSMDIELPELKNSGTPVGSKVAPTDTPSPANLSLSRASSTGLPPKKRGRKPKEVKAASVEEQDHHEEEPVKKPTTPAVRKDAAPVQPVVSNDDDEDTEEEIDEVNVCFICEKSTKGIERCQGPCHGHFHPSCLSQSSPVGGKFLCDACTADDHKCFICKQSKPTTTSCLVPDCGRFYHEECLRSFLPEGSNAAEDRPLPCPLHSCFTCQMKKLDKGSSSDDDNDLTDLLVCVRCPMAYHLTDSCVSAGSLGLTGKYIVCSRHFEPSKTHSLHTKISSSWCFICEKGSNLLCCECCPAAYHAACLGINSPPSGPWQCPDCSRGKTPLYGDLVWVKFGSYRWWPAEIYHPASLPSNIQDLPHQIGEFPVCFFGSHDYLWLHRGRVFPFKEGDKCCREADAKGTAKIFDKAMKEAIAVYRMLNPSIKPPAPSSTNDKSAEKLNRDKKKDDYDDDNDNGKKTNKDGVDDTTDAEAGFRSSQKAKAPPSGDRKTKRVKPNSKVLRQLQRQSRALSQMESPRLSTDGQPPKLVNDHETSCFRCGRDGSLILCDKPKCPKAYHLKCINKSKLPHGIWLCPWHHCDVCGKVAIQFCSRCPNSYCPEHVLNNIVFSYELGMVCSKHPDVKIDEDLQNMTMPLVFVDANPGAAGDSRPKESGEMGGKKRRQKSAVKKKSLPTAIGRRSSVMSPKLTDPVNDTRSDTKQPATVKDVAPIVGKAADSAKKTRKPRSKSRKSETFKKAKETETAPPMSAGRRDHSELDGSRAASVGKKPVSQLDSPMFDNSDDEFPQLVIDVPTL